MSEGLLSADVTVPAPPPPTPCSALKKHSASVCTLVKRVILAFNKESAELVSALLDFLRQILNSDSLVRPPPCSWLWSLPDLQDSHIGISRPGPLP